MFLKSALREPLLHFLLIGAAFFAWYQWNGGGAGPGSNRIALTGGQIAHLAAGYTKAWRRPPTDAELKGLIDDWVREEIAVREAMLAGLDRDDTIIRRRLRQKFEFLVEDAATAPPTDTELQAWLATHADTFRSESRVSLRQVFLSRERRGATARADATAILGRLRAEGPDARVDDLGDATMLPADIGMSTARDLDRLFGAGFARRIESVAPGTWVGPIESSYGLHLLLVRERQEAAMPELATVRPAVEREFLADRRQRQLDSKYAQLLARYTVVIDKPADVPAAAAASAASAAQRSDP
jgi:PPIC-type PPIASE domain